MKSKQNGNRLFERSKSLLREKVKNIKNPSEFSFVYLGDSWAGDGHASNAIFTEALRAAAQIKPTPLFITHGGDAVFTGSEEQFSTGSTKLFA